MGRINDGAMKDWQNGEIVTEALYEADREMLRVAINDNFDRLLKTIMVLDSSGSVKTSTTFDPTKTALRFKEGPGIGLTMNATNGEIQFAATVPDNTVTTIKLVDLSVTTAKLADLSVTDIKISPAAVTTTKLANAAVTGLKIASGAVTGDHILNGTITGDKLDPSIISNSPEVEAHNGDPNAHVGLVKVDGSRAMTGTLSITKGKLTDVNVRAVISAQFVQTANSANVVSLKTYANRKDAGTAWESVDLTLRRTVDATDQQFINFSGNGNLDLGTTAGEVIVFTNGVSHTSFSNDGNIYTKKITLEYGSEALRLRGNAADHVFMGFYPDNADPNSRKAYIGFGNAGSGDFTIMNEYGGNMNFSTGNSFQFNAPLIMADGRAIRVSYMSKKGGDFYFSNNADNTVLWQLDDSGNVSMANGRLTIRGNVLPELRNNGGRLEMEQFGWKPIYKGNIVSLFSSPLELTMNNGATPSDFFASSDYVCAGGSGRLSDFAIFADAGIVADRTCFIEVILRASPGNTAQVILAISAGAGIVESRISTTSTGYVRLRSGTFSGDALAGNVAFLSAESSQDQYVKSAKLYIL